MNINDFSVIIIGCSYHQWRYVLRAERNLSYAKAQVAAEVLVTPVEIWLDDTRQKERKEAWDRFKKKQEAEWN